MRNIHLHCGCDYFTGQTFENDKNSNIKGGGGRVQRVKCDGGELQIENMLLLLFSPCKQEDAKEEEVQSICKRFKHVSHCLIKEMIGSKATTVEVYIYVKLGRANQNT